jgi:8-oxo-dGTP pyrophosphatase MutT (NUDIX family)
VSDPFAGDLWGRPGLVHAGGGFVHRPGPSGRSQLLLVHRPKYDDWTLPKGKIADDDESGEDAALREVEEETGLRCRLLRPVGSTRYVDHKGRDKVARYWEMEAIDGEFSATDEVDDLEWLPVEQALDRLTYEHDRELVRRWEATG